jgi:hypothetical protein
VNAPEHETIAIIIIIIIDNVSENEFPLTGLGH